MPPRPADRDRTDLGLQSQPDLQEEVGIGVAEQFRNRVADQSRVVCRGWRASGQDEREAADAEPCRKHGPHLRGSVPG
ncbi:MAG: hypothetical protein F4Z31_09350 [Gemmatimonadetes bacterium]|nr:hypothetical protein [Gemmatimonadota bacterium]MYE93957.1 hypothetical protein [Gemmatimonadota bacterium]MYJ10378.1 hypothetical protein [Gemmatimonadota bacterium]